ncbi:hypothetical protein HMPREF9016_01619 [Neisseria sp. oral taxon 014 str. F0314]|nr:hypothetical protein HMPREF9016_01619 [Neisseria sp. oral taxon 014 str. F0314]
MAGFADYQRTHRLLIRSATRRKDKLRVAFFVSDGLIYREGRLKTWIILYNEEMQSDFHKTSKPKKHMQLETDGV